MAAITEAAALLESIDRLREQVEALDDPGRDDLLAQLKRARTEAEAVNARAVAEAARVKSGVGAAARYRRLR